MTRARWIAALIALAACKKGSASEGGDEEAPPAQVRCEAAVQGPHDDTVTVRGAIAPPPRAQAVVAAPVTGRIARIAVEEGDVVAAGALIAVLEDPTLGASAMESNADVAAAEAELRAATADRVRIEKLVAQGIAPQKQLDEAKAREEGATAHVAAARARAQLARGNMARAELRAPRAGTVLHVFRRAGDVIEGADPTIAEIADLAVLELRAQVTGPDLIGLEVGSATTIELDALPSVEIPGQVVAVAPALDAATSLGTVRVRIDPPAGIHLAVGLPGAATVHRAPRIAITIPASAVRRSLEGTDEVLVCDGDKAAVRSVTLGHRRAGAATVEVMSGLSAGERVIADHVLTLEDGAPITEQKPVGKAP